MTVVNKKIVKICAQNISFLIYKQQCWYHFRPCLICSLYSRFVSELSITFLWAQSASSATSSPLSASLRRSSWRLQGGKKRFLERVRDPNTSAGWLTVMGGAWDDVTGWEKYKRVPARHLQTPAEAGRAEESASPHLHPSAASHVLQHQRASSHHSLGLRAGR